MTSCMEFRARTVEKAIENACRELNLSREDLSHEVISAGDSGILGIIGIKKAKIRVVLKSSVKDHAAAASPESIGVLNGVDSRHQDGGMGGDAADTEAPGCRDDDNAELLALESAERIIQYINPEAKIEAVSRGGTIEIRVSGEDAALLIGKHGQTLDAVQYIVEKIVNRAAKKRLRIQVDVEGYQANRKKSLRLLAIKQAQKARRTGRTCSLGQMNANDRRIVHLALKDDRSIRTQSIGDGPLRKLLIIPRRQRARGQRVPADS